MYKFIAISIFIFFFISATAQTEMSFTKADQLTYKLYTDQNWDALKKEGSKILKSGLDSYYLRLRVGVSYYETRNYFMAIHQFEILLKRNPANELVQEYLYYSYSFSGRISDARALSKSFSAELAKKLKIQKNKVITALSVQTQTNFYSDYTDQQAFPSPVRQKVAKKLLYYGLSSEHFIGKKFTLWAGLGRINSTNQILTVLPLDSLPPIFTENIKQTELFTKLNYTAKFGLEFSGTAHYINVNVNATDTSNYPGKTSSQVYQYTLNNFAGALSVSKSYSYFNFKTGASFSNFENKYQFQPLFQVQYFPFGNANFMAQTKIQYLTTFSQGSNSGNPIFEQSFGFYFFRYLYLVPTISYGKRTNYTSYDAIVVNNQPDETLLKYSINTNLLLYKQKLIISLQYAHETKTNYYQILQENKSINYFTNLISGGITWYF